MDANSGNDNNCTLGGSFKALKLGWFLIGSDTGNRVGKRLWLRFSATALSDGYKVVGTSTGSNYPQLVIATWQWGRLQQVDFYQQSSLELPSLRWSRIRRHFELSFITLPTGSQSKKDPSENALQIMNDMMTIHTTVPYLMNLTLKGQLMSGIKLRISSTSMTTWKR